MAIGDDATDAGYPIVPETGTGAEVKWGAREINRTRDFVAQLKALIPTRKTFSGTAAPNNADGANGDIYYKIV